ncbi:group II intron maturase-specific domain-containing protein [Streptomyces sp. NPDC059161]|uniref:group II intron maturase-specific domain-containing protein n=1 Tax=Streptomyces sp. NPDC059161 TaxID=3346749 RepID=UPI0036B353F7
MDLEYVLDRLNMITHGWAHYFKHAIAKRVFSMLDSFTWWRLVRMLMHRFRWKWRDVRRTLTPPDRHWLPITAGKAQCRPIAAIPATRYRRRGLKIPTPFPFLEQA